MPLKIFREIVGAYKNSNAISLSTGSDQVSTMYVDGGTSSCMLHKYVGYDYCTVPVSASGLRSSKMW